jgi:hypothetical protein
MPDLETKDGIRVDVIFNINLQTTHAGESYKFDSWPANVWPSTRALTKDYVSSRTEEQLRAEQNELSTNPDGYIGRLRGLNDNSKGNISLSLRTGQRVNGGNLVDLAFENLVAEALEKKRIAEAEGDAEIAKQRKKKEAALEEAEVIKTLGGARNEVLQEKAAILAAPGGDNLAKTEVARELGEGMREHKGALGIGGTSSIMFDGREGGK